MDALLQHHDVRLHHHLRHLGVAPGIIGWTMLTSMFTEIVDKTEWLKLMDFLFSHVFNQSLFVLVPVAGKDTVQTLYRVSTNSVLTQYYLCTVLTQY